jgi:hypothetical protein
MKGIHILVRKPKEKKPQPGKPTHRLEDDIKIDLKYGVDWIHLARLREKSCFMQLVSRYLCHIVCQVCTNILEECVNEGNMFHWNAGIYLPDDMAPHTRRHSPYCEKSSLILYFINYQTLTTGKYYNLQNCPEEFYSVHACKAKPHSYQVHYCFTYKFSHDTCNSWNNYSLNLGKVKNQLDTTCMKFILCSLAQHISGINMPIIRSTM